MPHYSVVIAERTSDDPMFVVTEYEGMAIEFKLDGPAVVPHIPLDGLAGPQITEITELATDLIVYRNMEKVFRGRIHYSQDNLGPNRHTATFSAIDYRGMLDRRILWQDLNYDGIDQHQVAWNLIAYTQGLSGGDLGITRANSTPTGRTRIRNYEAGQNVGTLLQQLSEVIDGFEYHIDANRVFHLHYPERGEQKSFVLEYGGSVEEVIRTVSSSDFANAIRASGEQDFDEGGDPIPAPSATAIAANISTAVEGRYDYQLGLPDVKRQSTLQEHADFELVKRSVVNPSYSLVLASNPEPGMMSMGALWKGPSDLWVGDTAQLVIKSGRLNIITQVRVTEVTLNLESDDNETVRVSAGADTLTQRALKREKNIQTRLTELERR